MLHSKRRRTNTPTEVFPCPKQITHCLVVVAVVAVVVPFLLVVAPMHNYYLFCVWNLDQSKNLTSIFFSKRMLKNSAHCFRFRVIAAGSNAIKDI